MLLLLNFVQSARAPRGTLRHLLHPLTGEASSWQQHGLRWLLLMAHCRQHHGGAFAYWSRPLLPTTSWCRDAQQSCIMAAAALLPQLLQLGCRTSWRRCSLTSTSGQSVWSTWGLLRRRWEQTGGGCWSEVRTSDPPRPLGALHATAPWKPPQQCNTSVQRLLYPLDCNKQYATLHLECVVQSWL